MNIDNPKFARAVACFRLAYRARQRLYHFLEDANGRYGVAGNILSGGAYPHWPDAVRHRVRVLNRVLNRVNAAAFAARPPRVQMATMRTLAHDVTTAEIRREHAR